jgi:phage antirepressor YoqD-like protein
MPEILIAKDGFVILAMGYSGSKAMLFKEAYINAFNEMERALKTPMDRTELLAMAVLESQKVIAEKDAKIEEQSLLIEAKDEEIKEKDEKIERDAPLLTYASIILACVDAVVVSIIAQDYGMSAVAFNGLLHDLGIQYKRGERWYLYQEYAGMGYVVSYSTPYTGSDGSKRSRSDMRWTQRGRMFLYERLKDEGYLPVVER